MKEEKEKEISNDLVTFAVDFSQDKDKYIADIRISAPTEDFVEYLYRKLTSANNFGSCWSIDNGYVVTGLIFSYINWGQLYHYISELQMNLKLWCNVYQENFLNLDSAPLPIRKTLWKANPGVTKL